LHNFIVLGSPMCKLAILLLVPLMEFHFSQWSVNGVLPSLNGAVVELDL